MLVPEGMQVIFNPRAETENEYMAAAEAVRLARIRFSREFAVAKSRGAVTDGQATQAAIEKTEDELTTLQAKLYLIGRRLA
jgi:hypothetical protein